MKDIIMKTQEHNLRGMADNHTYKHHWDKLDADICRDAANEIRLLRDTITEIKTERDEYHDKWESIMEEEASSRKTYLMHTEHLLQEIENLKKNTSKN